MLAYKARASAQENFEHANDVVDQFFVEVSTNPALLDHRSGMLQLRHRLLEKSHVYFEQLAENNDDNQDVLLKWCRMLPDYTHSLRHHGQEKEGVRLLEKGLDVCDSMLDADSTSVDAKRALAHILIKLGQFKDNKHFKRSIALLREVHQSNPDDVEAKVALGEAFWRLAKAQERSSTDQARKNYHEAIRILSECRETGIVERAEAYGSYGRFLGREDGMMWIQRAIDLLAPAAKDSTNYKMKFALIMSFQYLGLAQSSLGQLDEAEESFRSSIAHSEAVVRADPSNVRYTAYLGSCFSNLMYVHIRQGRMGEALDAARRSLDVIDGNRDHSNSKKAVRLNDLAWSIVISTPEDCTAAESVSLKKIAIAQSKRACELTAWKLADFIDTLAAACAHNGDFDQAINYQQQAIELNTDPQLNKEFKERLALYQDGKPYTVSR